MKKNGYALIELAVIIVVLGVACIVFVNAVSPSFADRSVDLYQSKINVILKEAEVYGNINLTALKDNENKMIVSVDKLIEAGRLIADTDGNIIDPRNSNRTLNDLKIKIIYDENSETVNAEMVD